MLSYADKQKLNKWAEQMGCKKCEYYTDIEAKAEGEKPCKITYEFRGIPVLIYENSWQGIWVQLMYANIHKLYGEGKIKIPSPIKEIITKYIASKEESQ